MKKELLAAVAALDENINAYGVMKNDPVVHNHTRPGRTDSVLYFRICLAEYEARNLRAAILTKLRSM